MSEELTIPTRLFEDQKLKEIDLAGKKFLCLKKGTDYFVTAPLCPHSGAPLCEGSLDSKGNIICPLHGFKFNPRNGYNASGEGYKLKVYQLRTEEDKVIIKL